jgi:diaminopimelate decarboxylase
VSIGQHNYESIHRTDSRPDVSGFKQIEMHTPGGDFDVFGQFLFFQETFAFSAIEQHGIEQSQVCEVGSQGTFANLLQLPVNARGLRVNAQRRGFTPGTSPDPPQNRDHQRSEEDGPGTDHYDQVDNGGNDEDEEQAKPKGKKNQVLAGASILMKTFQAAPDFNPYGFLSENAESFDSIRSREWLGHALLNRKLLKAQKKYCRLKETISPDRNPLLTAARTASSRPFQYPKHGAGLHCDGVSIETLTRRFGTPLYVYSADQMVERLRMFQQALSGRDHLVCYAVKANSALAILKLLASHGAGFDIVSGGELERVIVAAPEAVDRVVFSGVGKTAEEIDRALAAGILEFNVESEAELELLAARARKLKQKTRFALRVNPDVFAETHPYISTGLREHKFGIDIRRAREIYRKAAGNRWLEPHGVSVHIGSQIRSADPFGAALERVNKLVRQLGREGIALRSIDAGGGLGIDYHGGSFDPASRVREYAAAIDDALEGFEGKLLLEPGRFLVAQAGALVARVLQVKRNGSKTFVITDAAMNDLIRPALYQAYHEIVPVKPHAGRARTVDVVGPVCETGDFFARDRKLAPVEAGELVALLDAGAYGMAQSSNYNTRLRPAEVLVEGKSARLIRRRETMADLLAPEMV